MKKDIYIIKNSVNDKVYIGQATDAAERWRRHLWDAKYEQKHKKRVSLIHKAINKYGYDKFHYEILESQIENYDEREVYWIQYYNSQVPYGYNIAPGGFGTGSGINSTNAIFKSEEDLDKCISEISASTKTFTNIAKKFNCSVEVIVSINAGKRYRRDNLVYPLRQNTYRYRPELVKQIIYSLKYELDLTYRDLAKKYNVDCSQISLINAGKIYYISSENYPLRSKRFKDLSQEVVYEIIDDIQNSTLSMTDIANKYKISKNRLPSINSGRSYQIDITYPIRDELDPRNHTNKKFIDINEIREIIEELMGDKSIREIAKLHNVSTTTIQNINTGKCKKYIIDGVVYPVKKMRHKK